MIDTIASVRHTISIGRTPGMRMKSKNSIGKDAVLAVMSMPGAFDVQVESETADVAVVCYAWYLPQPFNGTAAHLAQRGLRRIDWL